jgi:hypothetical protein
MKAMQESRNSLNDLRSRVADLLERL